MIRIRTKLVFAISLLVVILFTAAALLFISERKVDIADDIFQNALNFSRLTATDVTEDYDQFLAQGSFVYFNREIKTVFAQNDDVSRIQVVSFDGRILYDSDFDKEKRFEGASREVDDGFLKLVKSENISVRGVNGEIVFLRVNQDGEVEFIDQEERFAEPFEPGTLVEFITVPGSEKYSVVYYLDYSSLDRQVSLMMRRIIYLALFGIFLGIVMSLFISGRLTRPVGKLVGGVKSIAKGDFKTRVKIKTKDEIGYLGDAFNAMASDLEESLEAKLYKERVTRELELATQIQNQIVPNADEIPKMDGLDVAAGLIPAEEIGGDIYDFMDIGDGKFLMYLGDVTGHGVPAGIVSAIANALFYGYRGFLDLKKIVVEVNKVMKVKTMPNMFLTLCLIEWDSLNKKFTYVNAGHEKLVEFKVSNNKTILRDSGGIAIGMIPDVTNHVKLEEVTLEVGDIIVVYSDGVQEAWANSKDQYGLERLQKVVSSNAQKSAEEIKTAIFSDLKTFMGDYKQMDDITLIVIKRV